MNLAQMTFVGRMNGDAAIPQSLLSGPDGGPAVCVATVTSFASYPNPYTAPLTVSYSMVGGGGGGSSALSTSGGGGGSSGVVVNGTLAAYASGGNGATATGTSPVSGAAGAVATGTVSVPSAGVLTVYVGGGGGGGGSNYGAGGGAGAFGGGGTFTLYGGGGGSNTGGSATGSGVAGSAFAGGAGGGSHPGLGGTAIFGGFGTTSVVGGGGGGGGFGGGGGGGNPVTGTIGSGGSNGNSGSGETVDGGSIASIGANTWATATTLPAAAGAGGVGATQAGGNAGLVILSYVPPTGVCALQDAPPGYVVSATTGGDATVVNLLTGIPPIPDASLTSAQTVEYEQYVLLAQRDGGPAGGSAEYRGTIRDKLHACAAIVAPTAVQTFASSDAGPDAAYMTPAVSVTSQCSDSGPCNCVLSTPCGMGKGRYLDCTATTVLHVAQ
jgi:hypothetical protein